MGPVLPGLKALKAWSSATAVLPLSNFLCLFRSHSTEFSASGPFPSAQGLPNLGTLLLGTLLSSAFSSSLFSRVPRSLWCGQNDCPCLSYRLLIWLVHAMHVDQALTVVPLQGCAGS